ncbi:hypothetical protein [Kitasatospora sp. GP82]|uniref:hypothetical protein n=1 Tax=Kitasatospora sp. GP82 TaxID=3035089 RepID=UPI002476CC7A|nr:hypothetical protein [Kitasatospora sp. GP82]
MSALLAVAPAVAAPAWADGGAELVLVPPGAVEVRSGGRSTLHAEVVNVGTESTDETVTISIGLAPGVFIMQPLPSACRPMPFGHSTTCTFPGGLRPGQVDSVDLGIVTSQGLDPGTRIGGVSASTTCGLPVQGSPTHFPIVVLP